MLWTRFGSTSVGEATRRVPPRFGWPPAWAADAGALAAEAPPAGDAAATGEPPATGDPPAADVAGATVGLAGAPIGAQAASSEAVADNPISLSNCRRDRVDRRTSSFLI